jgi:hypothetical protein
MGNIINKILTMLTIRSTNNIILILLYLSKRERKKSVKLLAL